MGCPRGLFLGGYECEKAFAKRLDGAQLKFYFKQFFDLYGHRVFAIEVEGANGADGGCGFFI